VGNKLPTLQKFGSVVTFLIATLPTVMKIAMPTTVTLFAPVWKETYHSLGHVSPQKHSSACGLCSPTIRGSFKCVFSCRQPVHIRTYGQLRHTQQRQVFTALVQVTKGFHHSLEDIDPDQSFVVCAGSAKQPLIRSLIYSEHHFLFGIYDTSKTVYLDPTGDICIWLHSSSQLDISNSPKNT
jgi:hypothetical protein